MYFGIEYYLIIIGLIIIVIFLVIRVLHAIRSGKLTKISNEIAEKSIKDEEKHQPLLQLVDSIQCEELPQKDACSALLFNIADMLFMENVPVIKATLENKGTEVILGVKITSFFLYAGDENKLKQCPDFSDIFSYKEIECQKDFILKPEEKKDIYFAIPDRNKEQIKKIVESETFMLSLEFEIVSKAMLVKKQKSLTAIVGSGEVKNCLFKSICLE